MTTTTDDGREWISEKVQGNESDAIDTIALGTGTGNEGSGAQSLANEVHRAHRSNSDVTFPEGNNPGEFEAVINITGGAEVPDGTEITEIGVFAGGEDGSDTLIVIDEFSKVTVDQGHTEEFYIPISITE